MQNALICNGTALSPGRDSVKGRFPRITGEMSVYRQRGAVPGEGTVLEPLSRIIGMKYAGTVLSLHIFKGVLHFATRPFCYSKIGVEK